MFENITKFLKKFKKPEMQDTKSKETAKERLHLVLMQDRANVSVDFLEMMKQEIIEVIKKYIDVDDNAIDVRLTNKTNDDGTNGAPALYANIPIISIKNEKKVEINDNKINSKKEDVGKETIQEKNDNQENKDVTNKEIKNDMNKQSSKDTKPTEDEENDLKHEEESNSNEKNEVSE